MQFWEKNFETSVAICFAAGFVHSCIFCKAFYVWNSAWVVYRAFVMRHRHKIVAFSINIQCKTSSFQASLTFKATATPKQWNVEPNISQKGPGLGKWKNFTVLSFSRSSSSIAGLWFVFWRPSFLSCFISASNIFGENKLGVFSEGNTTVVGRWIKKSFNAISERE